MAFVLGPIQIITRTVTEAPSHPACVEYALRVSFLTNPARMRGDISARDGPPANPGVFASWITRSYELAELRGRPALIVGDPLRVGWWTQGRRATRAEVETALSVARRCCAKEEAPY